MTSTLTVKEEKEAGDKWKVEDRKKKVIFRVELLTNYKTKRWVMVTFLLWCLNSKSKEFLFRKTEGEVGIVSRFGIIKHEE